MRSFYIIALLIWILVSILWSKKTFCGNDEGKKPSASAVPAVSSNDSGDCDNSLVFEDTDFSFTSSDNFVFKKNETKFITPDGVLKTALTELSEYLGNNTERSVLLEGVYFEDEANDTNKENLGIARASRLKFHLVNEFGLDPDQVKIGGKVSSNKSCYLNEEKGFLTKGAVVTFGEK